MKPIFPILFLASLLSACSSGATITQDSFRQRMLDGLYQYGAGARDLKLVVTGNPFSMPQEAFAAAVEDAMPEQTGLSPATYPKLDPGPSAKPNYSLVFAFQPPLSGGPDDLCQGERKGQSILAAPVRLDAAFCISGVAYSYAAGHANAKDANDPAFQSLIKQMMLALFYSDSLLEGGNGDGFVK